MTDTTNDVAKLTELAKGIHTAMLTTVDNDGQFYSRPMGVQDVDFGADLWFFADRSSTAVTQIQAHPHVNLALTSASTWISISGSATIVDDPDKVHELWNPVVEAWMPEGPDAPNVTLIKVDGESAEYWDTPGGRVASVISFAKAKITGEPYDGGDNAKVDL
ncbi:pyridoxamine 5'-phosphate oxidase family protein [soil metagenome]